MGRGKWLAFTTLDHKLTLPALNLQRLEALGVTIDMQWRTYALYESVSGKVCSPNGLSETIASTIGVKQGCKLSLALFELYIDAISHYI